MNWMGLLALSAITWTSCANAGELVMFETEGCLYCAAWNRDIAPAYVRSDLASKMPLRRIGLKSDRPKGYEHIAGIRLSPTFIALACGQEVARIEGYREAGPFWELISMADEKVRSREAAGNCPP